MANNNVNMDKVFKDYDWAQHKMHEMGIDYYFKHASKPFTTAHSVEQTLARTSSLILSDMRKDA